MKLLKITASLLLLLQAFHLVCLQSTTESPGRTIDKSWLRQLPKNKAESGNGGFSGGTTLDQGADPTAEFSSDFDSGFASGFMAEEEPNMSTQDKSPNQTFADANVFSTILPSGFENETTEEQKPSDAAISPRNVTTEFTNSSQTNMTDSEKESTMTAENGTSIGGVFDNTNLQSTTTTENQPMTTTTTTTQEEDNPSVTTTAEPDIYRTTTKPLTTTAPPSETTETSPVTTTTAILNNPDLANKTGKVQLGSDRGSVAETGSEMDSYRSKRNAAWVAVLGTAAATAVVGLVAYIILKKKHQKAFTHRKLVEEYPADPVLRLDNSEPLDLNYGGSAYYNPALQGDSIQMTNIPARR